MEISRCLLVGIYRRERWGGPESNAREVEGVGNQAPAKTGSRRARSLATATAFVMWSQIRSGEMRRSIWASWSASRTLGCTPESTI